MADLEKVKNRVLELRELIKWHNHAYYVEDNPTISDAEYDKLFSELKELEARHGDIFSEDSPTQRVGAEPSRAFRPSKHGRSMLSLGNVFSEDELIDFDKRVKIGLYPPPVCGCLRTVLSSVRGIAARSSTSRTPERSFYGDGRIRLSGVTQHPC